MMLTEAESGSVEPAATARARAKFVADALYDAMMTGDATRVAAVVDLAVQIVDVTGRAALLTAVEEEQARRQRARAAENPPQSAATSRPRTRRAS